MDEFSWNFVISLSAVHTHTHTHTPFYGSLDFVRDNLGEPVPEETFIHSHLSWSSIVPYLLHPSNMIHGILPVQSTYLTVFFQYTLYRLVVLLLCRAVLTLQCMMFRRHSSMCYTLLHCTKAQSALEILWNCLSMRFSFMLMLTVVYWLTLRSASTLLVETHNYRSAKRLNNGNLSALTCQNDTTAVYCEIIRKQAGWPSVVGCK